MATRKSNRKPKLYKYPKHPAENASIAVLKKYESACKEVDRKNKPYEEWLSEQKRAEKARKTVLGRTKKLKNKPYAPERIAQKRKRKQWSIKV